MNAGRDSVPGNGPGQLKTPTRRGPCVGVYRRRWSYVIVLEGGLAR